MSCRWRCHANILRPLRKKTPKPWQGSDTCVTWIGYFHNKLWTHLQEFWRLLHSGYTSTIACGHCRHPPEPKADLHPLKGFSVSCLPHYTIREHFLIFGNILSFFFCSLTLLCLGKDNIGPPPPPGATTLHTAGGGVLQTMHVQTRRCLCWVIWDWLFCLGLFFTGNKYDISQKM